MFDIDSIKSLEDTQRSNFYRAKVVSLDDPISLNRIQILIFGLTDDIPNESQPWCELQFRDGLVTYPNVNDVIWLFFEGGDIFRPIYLGTIYAGLDVGTDVGYEKFAANLGTTTPEPSSYTGLGGKASYNFSAITDVETYKSALRTVNAVETDKHTILKDTSSHYDVLTKENTWGRTFEGLEPIDTSQIAEGEFLWVTGRDPAYGACPFPSGQAVYPWYELRETGTNTTNWKAIYGGWRMITEADLKKGLAPFPDNIRRTYLKRYKSWTWWTVNRCLNKDIWAPDAGMFANASPKSWTFIPSSPWIYTDPELFSVAYTKDSLGIHSEEMGGYCRIKPSPFATMKIKNRKYYKQFTWLSYDGKSTIEMDDNDLYERLRLDFNYGESGLEFSRVGWHGLSIWTEGSFRIRAYGRQSGGTGEGAFVPCAIEVVDTSLSIQADGSLWCGGNRSASLGSLGPVGIRSKMDGVSIAGKSVTIQTETGLSTREGTTEANEGVKFGSPIISSDGSKVTGGMNGWLPILSDKEKKDAQDYFDSFNAVIVSIKTLVDKLSVPPPPSTPPLAASFCTQIYAWAVNTKPLLKSILKTTGLDAIPVMGANENINIEGAAKGEG
jgi:hypothetical protein